MLQTRISRDLDSAIRVSCMLPYTRALVIWPIPPFKEMLMKDNHAQSHAYNAQVRPSDGNSRWQILTMIPGQ